jgi:hypothetical protein
MLLKQADFGQFLIWFYRPAFDTLSSNGTLTTYIPLNRIGTTEFPVFSMNANIASCYLSRFPPEQITLDMVEVFGGQAGKGFNLTGFSAYFRDPPLRGRPHGGVRNLKVART